MPAKRSAIYRLGRGLLGVYQFLFARACFARFNRVLYLLSLHGLGVLNYQNDRASGERAFLKRLLPRLRADAVVFDVGANVGDYAALIRRLSPGARVFAFEPNPTTFERLRQESERSGFTAINMGCAEKSGRLTLYDYDDNCASAHATVFKEVFDTVHRHASQAIEVMMVDLDSFVQERRLDRIDFLKIDSEGYELPILKGAQSLIARGQIDVIQFEFSELHVISRTFLRDLLQLLTGYRFFRLLRDGLLPLEPYDAKHCEIFAFQNIVALRTGSEVCQTLLNR